MKTVGFLLTKSTTRVLPFLLLLSCISPIEVIVENKGGQVVISGQVSSLPDRTMIEIGRTAYKQLPSPESGASILLLNQNGTTFFFQETSLGVYSVPGFQGVPGQTYHVEITLTNGATYRSTPEVMPSFAPPVEVKHEFVEKVVTDSDGANLPEKFVHIYASTTLPQEWKDRYINWTVEEVFLLTPTDFPDPFGFVPPPCFVYQKADPNRVALLDGTRLTIDRIEKELVCARIVDRSFLEKHYFNTYQSSITDEAYEYWRKVNILANQTGSIFDTPPAQIIGNIKNINNPSEKVWGYFQATHESMDRFVLYPTDFPYRVFFPFEDCTYYESRFFQTPSYPQYCYDCTLYRNSSYKRPDWF